MKDHRNALLLLLSLLLLISNGMLFAAIYYFYFKAPAVSPLSTKEINPRDTIFQIKETTPPAKAATAAGSSLAEITAAFDAAISATDSLKSDIDLKYLAMVRLRNRLDSLTGYPIDGYDSVSAGKQMAALHSEADSLRSKLKQEKEANDQLQLRLHQLYSATPLKNSVAPPRVSNQLQYHSNNRKTATGNDLFLLYALRFDATAQAGSRTVKAANARSLSAIFKVKNKWMTDTAAQLYVTVLQPSGQALPINDNDATVFVTKEGVALNAKKLSINYQKGEGREVSFHTGVKGLTPGTYTLKVYHNQRLIGKINKVLL